MLKRRFAEIVLNGNCLQHLAGIRRSELTHTNMTYTLADVIVPDFPISLFRGLAQLFYIRKIDFLDELLQNHAALRRKSTCIYPVHEFCFERHDLGFERIIRDASQLFCLLLKFGRTILPPHAHTVSNEPRSMVNVQLPILIANRFGHYVLLNDLPCSHSPTGVQPICIVPRCPNEIARSGQASNEG